jgi:nucleoside-diphosphate-sugar epimerase
MRIVVTGSGGRLGSVACARLVEAGHEVVGVDRKPSPRAAHRTIVEDLLEPLAVHRVFERIDGHADAVVHLAGHVNANVAPGDVVLRDNLAIAGSVFQNACSYGVRRLVFASSVQAFLGGMDLPETVAEEDLPRPPRLPVDETLEPRPTNAYGLSKLLIERMLTELTSHHLGDWTRSNNRPSAVSLRFPFIMGDRGFRWAGSPTHRPDYRFSGPEVWSYVHIEDAAEAVVRSVEAAQIGSGGGGHEVLWAAAPDVRHADPIADLVERYYAQVPGAAEAVARDSLSDLSKAERVIGWRAMRLVRDKRERAASES